MCTRLISRMREGSPPQQWKATSYSHTDFCRRSVRLAQMGLQRSPRTSSSAMSSDMLSMAPPTAARRCVGRCMPSIRRWRLTGLPTFLPPQKVQQVLDASDQTTALGLRDYAVLMVLAKLGLRASEVAALSLDYIDWRLGKILVHGKGRQQVIMPLRHDVGTSIVAYIHHGRPISPCRRLFLRMLAPHIGFTSGSAITMIAKQAFVAMRISAPTSSATASPPTCCGREPALPRSGNCFVTGTSTAQGSMPSSTSRSCAN